MIRLKNKDREQMDMLNSSLWKAVLLFSLPIAFSNILQQLFNAVDIGVVGKFASDNDMTAVSANATVTALFINIVTGLSVGPNVIIAKLIGQDRKREIQDAVHTVIAFALIFGIVLMGIGEAVADPLLRVISTQESIFDLAKLYYRIYFLGIPFFVVYCFGAAILRSKGDTFRPLIILMISGVFNTALNLVLVILFHMGVAGVAIATSMSNALSAICILILLCRESDMVRLSWKKVRIHKEYLSKIIKVGFPAALQSAVFSISNVCIQKGINSFGEEATAGSMVGLTYEYYCFYLINSFSQAAITFTGQNYGARKLDRCKKIILVCSVEGMVLTIVLSSVFMIFGHPLTGLFTGNELIIMYALTRMQHIMTLEFLTGTYEIAGGVLRGTGRSLLPAIITVIGSVCFRIFWLFCIFPIKHSFGLLMSVYPVSWVLTAAMMYTAYYFVTRKVFNEESTLV